MTQFPYFTEPMQHEQAAVNPAAWQALAAQKSRLLTKLTCLACKVAQLHDAMLDPLLLKGLCLALDASYQIEDAAVIEAHCAAVDVVLQAHGLPLESKLPPLCPTEDDLYKDLQLQLLSLLHPIAQTAYSALLLGKRSYHINFFFYMALSALPTAPAAHLETLLLRARGIYSFSLELLDQALHTPQA